MSLTVKQACAQSGDKCESWKPEVWTTKHKRTLEVTSPVEYSERALDPQNQLPEWAMCSDLDGGFVAVFPRSAIVRAIAAGFDL